MRELTYMELQHVNGGVQFPKLPSGKAITFGLDVIRNGPLVALAELALVTAFAAILPWGISSFVTLSEQGIKYVAMAGAGIGGAIVWAANRYYFSPNADKKED